MDMHRTGLREPPKQTSLLFTKLLRVSFLLIVTVSVATFLLANTCTPAGLAKLILDFSPLRERHSAWETLDSGANCFGSKLIFSYN